MLATALLPLLAVATASGSAARSETVTSPRAAQARLASSLASADAIDTVTANDRAVTFTLASRGEALELVAAIDPAGTIQSLAITDLGPTKAGAASLTWLVPALADTTAITTLAVDDAGRVRLTTSTGRDYLLLADHAEQVTNAGVESMWAAAWDW